MIRRTLSITTAVLCAAGAANAQARWTLTETLRIGGDETGPASLTYVKAIEADAKGRILIYDRSTKDIRMFGPDGKFVRIIGRLGSGPGEFRDAEGIAIARDGRIWARDAANTRFSVFNAEGVYEKGWTMKFCTSQGAWNPQMDRAGRIIDEDCMIRDGRGQGMAVLAYHVDMTRIDTIADKPECGTREQGEAGTWITRTGRGTSYRGIPWWPGARSAIGPDGEVWCAPNTARYEVQRFRPGTKDTVRTVRTVATVPVTDFERDSVVAIYEKNGPSGLDFSRIPKVKPAIERLTVDDQGRLWVRRSKAKGVIEFDVFSSNGRIIATTELGVFNSSTYQPFIVRGDNMYTVVLDQDDVQHVVRFRIGR